MYEVTAMNAKLILFGLVVMIALGLCCDVRGQDLTYGSWYQPLCWNAFQTGYSGESVPYFSLYPPVYYSYRVARTYGYSPFAYPPGVLTPSSVTPRSVIVQNLNPGEGGDASETSPGTHPLRIDNPFVEPSNGQGVTTTLKPTGRQPQVVYPTALVRRSN
jgi:hypothetical protein